MEQDNWREKYHLQSNEDETETIYIDKPSRRNGSIMKKFLTGLLIIALGLASGFSGAFLYQEYFAKNNATEAVIYQNVSPTTTTTITGDNGQEDMLEKVADTVVQIETESVKTGIFFGNYITSGAGSGVVITTNGYIVTNNHVVSGARKITVTLNNGNKYSAYVVGVDEDNDLAVIKIEETGLTPAVMGNSDNIRVGKTVYVIGNPLGTLGGSVTSGIISALSRNVTVEHKQMNLLQIDAAVNPGNSGGALYDVDGNLIGIINAKYQSEDTEGIGFAIPINRVKTIAEQLISNGTAGKVRLGVTIADVYDSVTAAYYEVDEYGIYITDIIKNSDAEKAGLQVKDRIITVDGKEVTSVKDISPIIQSHDVGDNVIITIDRDGVRIEVPIVLTEQATISS